MKRVRENLTTVLSCRCSVLRKPTTRNPWLSKLSFRELEALAGALLPVFLALFAARIAREHAFALQLFAQLSVENDERAGDAQLHRAGLAVHPAAGDAG